MTMHPSHEMAPRRAASFGKSIATLLAGALALTLAAAVAPAHEMPEPTAAGPAAPLLDGLGKHRRPTATKVPLAQRYFDQGLILADAFNHAKAARSFKKAAEAKAELAATSRLADVELAASRF